MFITIEGIEGCGKTTQALLLVNYLKSLDYEVIHTREPGGTLIAEKIREIFLDPKVTEKITAKTELLLMFAAREQHLQNVILPALSTGKHVVCERFTDASFAYQSGGRGISPKYIDFLVEFIQLDLNPDLVLLLDMPVDLALQRIKIRGKLDRIEQEKLDFFTKIRAAYLQRTLMDQNRYQVIDASLEITQIQTIIMNKIQLLLKK